jgi:microsomal dipeptidase-like Zn-dependent dipeptidase
VKLPSSKRFQARKLADGAHMSTAQVGQVQSFASVGFRAAQTRQNVSMNCSLELHDSRVSSVQSTGGVVTINFEAAYLHRSDGVPGSDEGTGWVQPGYLEFASASLNGAPDIGEGWIVDAC